MQPNPRPRIVLLTLASIASRGVTGLHPSREIHAQNAQPMYHSSCELKGRLDDSTKVKRSLRFRLAWYHATCKVEYRHSTNIGRTHTRRWRLFVFSPFTKTTCKGVFSGVCTPGVPGYLPPSMYPGITRVPNPDYIPGEYSTTYPRICTLGVPGT